MDAMKKGWFSEISEELWPGIAQSLEVVKVLYETRSQYQHIMVLETKTRGRALILDGVIQCTQNDEFSYQEMISYLPLCSHPNPETVLIVGGGDGGVAREVAKYSKVKRIVQIEIDEKVIEASKEYLPFMAQGLTHPKVTLHVGDGFEFMKQHKNEFDVIITDSSDPIGPAVSLFQQTYFNLMKEALKPNGIVCSQAGTIWLDVEQIKRMSQFCRVVFPSTAYGVVSVPTYPTGQIGFLLASCDLKMNFAEPTNVFTEQELDDMKFRYYSDKAHRAAFVLPRFAEKAFRVDNK